ncbi:hypothetical protein KI387_009401, partial [Taxus chinensis]
PRRIEKSYEGPALNEDVPHVHDNSGNRGVRKQFWFFAKVIEAQKENVEHIPTNQPDADMCLRVVGCGEILGNFPNEKK